MSLYNIDGEILIQDTADTPYMSSSAKPSLKEQSDFSMSGYDIIRTFTPFATDYSTQTSTPRVLSMTQQQFYDTFYEPYMGRHTNMTVTKKNLGKDQSGTYDVWCYDFVPYNAKRKILLSSAMHTYELPASFGLARWVKDFMESSDAVFQYMRENVQLSIIPIVNPWGFNHTPDKKYGNVNGVNPNRNFDNWEGAWEDFPEYSPDPTDPNYNEWNVKGSAPFSEAETQIISKWLKNNTDANFWIDCHTGLNNRASTYGDVWCVFVGESNILQARIRAAAQALGGHLQSVYSVTPRYNIVTDANTSIKSMYGDQVVGIPTMVIEQAQYSDTVYQTVPNNCPAAIKEYATMVHAYIVSQLQA
ncbi:MAG: DUF2817 domain-containing protein [Oscillospiraceae bacterium]|nr:DUF2817 domain-containing protein [Oscillospiraceae bacterium]